MTSRQGTGGLPGTGRGQSAPGVAGGVQSAGVFHEGGVVGKIVLMCEASGPAEPITAQP